MTWGEATSDVAPEARGAIRGPLAPQPGKAVVDMLMDPGSSLRSPGATEKINLPFTIPANLARGVIPAHPPALIVAAVASPNGRRARDQLLFWGDAIAVPGKSAWDGRIAG